MFGFIRDPLNQARDEAKDYLGRQGEKPRVFSANSFSTFFGSIPKVFRLIASEPEILVFAVCQWLVVWVAYLAWTQILHWIPDEVWAAVRDANETGRDDDEFWFVNLALLAWSFFIVAVASFPIGLCNAAMVASHNLRVAGQASTFARCLALAERNVGRIWIFTVMDGWITVTAILDRLPKKRGRRTAAEELIYYAWKVATTAVVPALVNGRTFFDAGADSVKMLKAQPRRALGLRLGYSALCWIVGVGSYIGMIALMFAYPVRGQAHEVYNVYLLAALPVFVSVGIVTVVLRPFYLLGAAQFYADNHDVTGSVHRDIAVIPDWWDFLFAWKTLLFLACVFALFLAIAFADRFGIVTYMDALGQKDLTAYWQRLAPAR